MAYLLHEGHNSSLLTNVSFGQSEQRSMLGVTSFHSGKFTSEHDTDRKYGKWVEGIWGRRLSITLRIVPQLSLRQAHLYLKIIVKKAAPPHLVPN